MLDPYPYTQLCLILKQYGLSIIDDPKRCKGLLSDLAPQQRLESNLLILALEQKIAEQLLKPTGLMPVELEIERLAQSLHEAVGIEEELAYWAVESWALALGVIAQPMPRQIIQSKQQSLPLPVLPPSTKTLLKQNQRLSLIIFFVVWLIGGILLAGTFAFFSKTKQDIKTPIANQTTIVEPQKPEEPQIYRIEPEHRDAWTENNIGDSYYYAKNYSKASEWYFKSAQQGDALAQCNLAFMYFNGYGVAKDYQKAMQWYTKAAEQGSAEAQNDLGIMYEYGYGVAKDRQKAVEWYSKAVEQGHYGAQQTLKILLEKP